jgi:hypothetical protein
MDLNLCYKSGEKGAYWSYLTLVVIKLISEMSYFLYDNILDN